MAGQGTQGRLAYAIGDVHGRADLFANLLDAIAADAARDAPAGRPLLLLLGDLIDRGPDSRGVVEAALALAAQGAFQVATLRGNHEAALLDFLDDPVEGAAWLEWGGLATLASYGVAAPEILDEPALWALHEAFVEALPPRHLVFLRDTPLCAVLGDYLFVHAGVRPDTALEAQADDDLLWIREPFLSHPRPSAYVVVHGHTPTREPYEGAERIGVDTGAYATGVLTAVRLEGRERRFVQARAGAAAIPWPARAQA